MREKLAYLQTRVAYSFRHADIGLVADFGKPTDGTLRSQWPAYSKEVDHEDDAFDVYLVDGRFRVACACRALLHGRDDSLLLIHDFPHEDQDSSIPQWNRDLDLQRGYNTILDVADVVEQVRSLVVLRRKASAHDETIRALWKTHQFIVW